MSTSGLVSRCFSVIGLGRCDFWNNLWYFYLILDIGNERFDVCYMLFNIIIVCHRHHHLKEHQQHRRRYH